MQYCRPQVVDVSATNVHGMGASQLVQALLPALDSHNGYTVGSLALPDRGPLSSYRGKAARVTRYRRRLPNAISRFLECALFGSDSDRPLLVLGDIPLRHSGEQVVLLHTPHIFETPTLKYRVSAWIFRRNLRFVSRVIVQTKTMKARLLAAIPALAGRIEIVAQPPPQWLLDSGLRRKGRVHQGPLRLFYPAAAYRHKNHAILDGVEGVTLSIDAPGGAMGPADMIAAYASTDALVFPSLDESYGLPLVEAMHIGLPILCADRPYAHDLCGDGAIYFDPRSRSSLMAAIAELGGRLEAGWWPDWRARVASIPATWSDVADRMLAQFDHQCRPDLRSVA